MSWMLWAIIVIVLLVVVGFLTIDTNLLECLKQKAVGESFLACFKLRAQLAIG